MRTVSFHWLWHWAPGSEPGSQQRNVLSYLFALLTCLLLIELFAGFADQLIGLATLTLVIFPVLALIYFYLVTLGVIRLISPDFNIAPVRLARDVFISTAYTVTSFALLFQRLGIVDTLDSTQAENAGTYLYFSVVTFSTLGYGDFRPEPEARFAAASEAILGNLHLSMIVGAVYLAIQVLTKPRK